MATTKAAATKPAKAAAGAAPKALAAGDKALAAKAAQAVVVAAVAEPHTYRDGWKVPKTLSAGIDAFWKKQEERKAAAKAAEKLEGEEKDLKHWIKEELQKQGASSHGGKLCRVTLKRKETPRVEDWSKVYATIVADYSSNVRKKTGQQDGAFAMLQKRLGETAVNERWAAGKTVDGITKFTYTDLSVSKV